MEGEHLPLGQRPGLREGGTGRGRGYEPVFAPAAGLDEVPDPYYGGLEGFDRVLDLVEIASAGLLERLRERLADQ